MLVNRRTPAPISLRSRLAPFLALAAALACCVTGVAGCGSQPPAPIATPMVIAPSGGPVWAPAESQVEESAPPAAPAATDPAPAASAAASTSAAPAPKAK